MANIELITPDTPREPIYQFLVEQMHLHYRRPLDSEHNKYFLQLAEHYSPDKRSSFYVLYENGEVVGTGCISPLEAHHRRPPHCVDESLWGYISRVYIHRKHKVQAMDVRFIRYWKQEPKSLVILIYV
ncbi:GNAT family N-acetyltransferase [Veillonella sp.]|uniref:GNAT family N-acetyltransferase n=1 Tax=Veillonella sp. TaxID=1926307 RepID=UPI0025FA03BF|nr:GNAT family N-acetyltransferase [Veillonella sp.]